MDALIKAALNTKVFSRTGQGGHGCISEGEGYTTDKGDVFVKKNSKAEARLMFDGEYESLKAIHATDTVTVPKPFVVLDNPSGGAVIVVEYVVMSSLRKYAAQLGEQLAKMHLHNTEGRTDYVDKFGFCCPTCCGSIPQDNTWCDDWVSKDKELESLWLQLQPKIPQFFKDIQVKPSLLHGDLWSGNAAETSEGPVVFDPASFYGHSEYDLAIAKMFGGFGNGFFQAYHAVIPKAPGFEERHQLYQLFHYLNHWNHFGSGYRGSSISIMKRLIKK